MADISEPRLLSSNEHLLQAVETALEAMRDCQHNAHSGKVCFDGDEWHERWATLSEARRRLKGAHETSDSERTLRRLLAFAYSAPGELYGDDGELQNGAMLPVIDFKRDSVAEIERKIHERGNRKLAAAGLTQETSEHRDYAAVRDAHDRTVQELDRYKQALTRANGFLIMHGHEPVKLEYSQTSQEGLASAGSSAAVNPRDAVGGSAEPSGRPAAPRHLTPPERDALTRAADGSVTEIDAGYEDDREAIAPGDYHYYKPSGRVDQPEKASVNPYCLQDGVPCASDGRGGCLACVDGKGTLNGKTEP